VLLATVYALAAAVLHAGWNLIAKRSVEPFLALWGQFLLAGIISVPILIVTGGTPAGAWKWALISGAVHIPYTVALGWAYRHGDFSLAYPIARGGGALLAGVGGLVLLDDELSRLSLVAIVVVVGGMSLLARGADRLQVTAALIVAATIGAYTLSDSHAAREYDTYKYVFVSQIMSAIMISGAGIAMGRGRALLAIPKDTWLRMLAASVMTIAAYGLVLVAVQRAAVGYVAALRESSVLIAVFVGSRYLGEAGEKARATAAATIVTGLVLLVVAR
jgi:drug/metabolite transporter (DMT)-like permease